MSDDSTEHWVDLLLNGDRSEREAAAAAIKGRVFDLACLVPVLEHPHVSRQVKAIEVLRGSRTREAVELLVPFLASENSLIVQKTVSSLGRIGTAAPEVIRAALDTAKTPLHRLHILDVLSRLGDPLGREVLLVEADAWDAAHRQLAIDYLRRYRNEPPIETIVGALADPDARIAAIDVAGRLQHDAFVRPLVAICLEDKPPDKAVHALVKFSIRAVHAVLERVNEVDRHERIERVLTDLLLRSDVLEHFWSTLWPRTETPVRNACLQRLATYPHEFSRSRVRAALVEHVRDPDPMRRVWCIHGFDRLREIKDNDGVAAMLALRRFADDPDEDVRFRAGVALGRVVVK